MGLLFKVHMTQVKEELDLINQQRSASPVNSINEMQLESRLRMVVCSFMLRNSNQ